jgi:hypothetical protein
MATKSMLCWQAFAFGYNFRINALLAGICIWLQLPFAIEMASIFLSKNLGMAIGFIVET